MDWRSSVPVCRPKDPMTDTAPPRPWFSSLRVLLPALRRQRTLLGGWLLALALASAAALSMPLAVKLAFDHGFSDAARIDRVFPLLIGAIVAFAATGALQGIVVALLGERIVADLRSRLYGHLIALDIDFHERNRSGELMARLAADTELVRGVVGTSLPGAIRAAITLVGGTTMLFVTSPALALWTLLALPLLAVPVLMNGERLGRAAREAQDRIGDAIAHAAETLGASAAVRAHAREAHERLRFAGALGGAVRAADRRIAIQATITFVAVAVVSILLLFVSWRGLSLVQDGRMSAGELGQFMVYAALCAGSVGELTEVWHDLQRIAGGLGRIDELLARPAGIRSPAQPRAVPQPLRGELHFESVDFRYPQRPELAALSGFDLQVRPGETVALVGPSGAGKSTVLALLLRFHDPVAGRVRVDGIDLAALDLEAWRNHVALVPQQPTLFAASLADNLRYARLDASDDELREALRIAHADAFVDALPDGLDTPLGERGALLSGGQAQRIAIARAVLRDAPILLLDEATSALDAQSEHAVREAMDTLARGRTTLVIAHRLSTVQRADRIVVMDRGRIVAEGRHAELLAQGGLYAELATLQLLR